jgi:hypothetical protein
MSSKRILKGNTHLTHINTSTHLQRQKDRVDQNSFNMKTNDLFEMEYPSCYDTMTLCCDADSLYYFCEQDGFSLNHILSYLFPNTFIAVTL